MQLPGWFLILHGLSTGSCSSAWLLSQQSTSSSEKMIQQCHLLSQRKSGKSPKHTWHVIQTEKSLPCVITQLNCVLRSGHTLKNSCDESCKLSPPQSENWSWCRRRLYLSPIQPTLPLQVAGISTPQWSELPAVLPHHTENTISYKTNQVISPKYLC